MLDAFFKCIVDDRYHTNLSIMNNIVASTVDIATVEKLGH
jgi:hypothetical protein